MLIRDLMQTTGVRFGTSGARGLAADMSVAVCYAYTAAFLQVTGRKEGGEVALGMDLRPSSPQIAAACAAAVRDAGLEAIFCGILPTPALAYFARRRGIPAIMVTGSHIPFDRNGIKFYRPEGEITKADEVGIGNADVPVPEWAARTDSLVPEMLPQPSTDAARCYIRRYLDFFPAGVLSGMRLGFYEHSSVARDLLREILQGLGASVISLGRTEHFVPIDTEAVSDDDMRRAHAWAEEFRFDAILSTDGDADRPLLGDEHGDWLRGDIVGILCARYLGAKAVATPVSSNTALERCQWFDHVARTRIGSPYVIAAMERFAAAGVAEIAGFEANGGFLLGSRVESEGRVLDALPTRDAVLPILALLALARTQKVPVSRLPVGLPHRYTASERLQDVTPDRSRALLVRLAESGTALADFFAPLGLQAEAMDFTDGLRVTLGTGEIAHLRASGNAPELRCYAEADTQKRAVELVGAVLQKVGHLMETADANP